MADKIAFSLETMMSELNYLCKKGYFSEVEIRDIIKKREEMEYRMAKNSYETLDFLRPLQFEMDLVYLKGKIQKAEEIRFKHSK